MAATNSIDKIVTRYFKVVTKEPFSYKGVIYSDKPLKLSPTLLRGYTCPPHCAGCCPRFSLDYLPHEYHPYPLEKRYITFNNREIEIYSDRQTDHNNYHCRNVRHSDGRCIIHGKQPFSCDFELIRPMLYQDNNRPDVLTQRLFGRYWNMKRIDGERGTLCQMTDVTNESINDVIRRLQLLQEWCYHFGLLNTKINEIIDWCSEMKNKKEITPKLIK